jgi:hypothetical protein
MSWRPNWMLGPLAIVVLGSLVVGSGRAEDPVPGGSGTDTSLPATDSQVTVSGRGGFSSLKVTVNQTKSLTNQAVSISWTGGAPTVTSPGLFSANYLQIMQCWGDPDRTNADNPGPPPEQCQFGAIASTSGTVNPSLYPNPVAVQRVIGVVGSNGFDAVKSQGFVDTRTGFVWKPFKAVNGKTVDVQVDPTFVPGVSGGNSWLNPYFNSITTNEVPGSKTDQNGNGTELFEVQTGFEADGLGCGKKVQAVAGGGTKIPQCWIVVVPRGDSLTENKGSSSESGIARDPVGTSPLILSSWANRIAIPLEFQNLDQPCALQDKERRLVGSDLPIIAISSWQPVLCSGTLPPYSYANVGDPGARLQLAVGGQGSPGMIAVSKPLDASPTDTTNPPVYAPLTLSGVTISFNIDRNVDITAPADELALDAIRVARLNLTPRLVAKLLTQSYRANVGIQFIVPETYTWASKNSNSLIKDPDFRRFNPEFVYLIESESRTLSGLQVAAGNADAAEFVWQWILADSEARAWLDGQADEWGMKVNPIYSTNATLNTTGVAFGNPLPNGFPKSDPYCYQAPPRGSNGSIIPPVLCGTDWLPYARNLGETAKIARIGFDGARIVENPNASSASQVWSRTAVQNPGRKAMLAISDTASSARFGLQMASLSRAGDVGAQREFIAPTDASLKAGVAAMTVDARTGARLPKPDGSAAGAYPLTTLTYAISKPLSMDAGERSDYAAFVEYASGAGQVSGLGVGQLPRGYAPLPDALIAEASKAATQIRTMKAPDVATSTTTTTTTIAQSSAGPTPTTVRRPSGSGSAVTTPPVTTEPPVTTDVVTETTTVDTTVPTTIAVDTTVPTSTTIAVTPEDDMPGGRFAMAGFGAVAAIASLFALEITKRARRASDLSPSGGAS